MSDVVTAAFANNEKVKCVESLLSHRLNGLLADSPQKIFGKISPENIS